ncbi:protein phosphatase inhibitor 2-like [Drosophila tropicalis]|uniref:protein phosphatase inhibitor 2-like n=1 Tax=Drosophila tropicalis TaxID=46794 RepID=UPI0035AC182B
MENDDAVRGILKVGGAYTQNPPQTTKTAKFDELNVLQTFHPADKDYGHMIIDEPKTPFVFEEDIPTDLDTTTLIEKLRLASNQEAPSFGMENDSDESSDDEDFPESVEEKVRRLEFERRRKLHYKEFLSVPLARRLIEQEFLHFATSSDLGTEGNASKDSEFSTMNICQSCEELSAIASLSVASEQSATHSSEDGVHISREPEPGLSPSHHCYQKLMADLENQGLTSISRIKTTTSVGNSESINHPRESHSSLIRPSGSGQKRKLSNPKQSTNEPNK